MVMCLQGNVDPVRGNTGRRRISLLAGELWIRGLELANLGCSHPQMVGVVVAAGRMIQTFTWRQVESIPRDSWHELQS